MDEWLRLSYSLLCQQAVLLWVMVWWESQLLVGYRQVLFMILNVGFVATETHTRDTH